MFVCEIDVLFGTPETQQVVLSSGLIISFGGGRSCIGASNSFLLELGGSSRGFWKEETKCRALDFCTCAALALTPALFATLAMDWIWMQARRYCSMHYELYSHVTVLCQGCLCIAATLKGCSPNLCQDGVKIGDLCRSSNFTDNQMTK